MSKEDIELLESWFNENEHIIKNTGKDSSLIGEKYIDYIFEDKSSIRIVCYDMDKDFFDTNDQLLVVVNSKQFMQFLNNL